MLNRMRNGSMKEMLVRHEFSPRQPDTFDVAMGLRQWWGAPHAVGGAFAGTGLNTGSFDDLSAHEQTRALDLHDETARKWLWWCDAEAKGQHLLMKSHLIEMVRPLKARHPDAAFVTVGREPVDMICSAVPFMGVKTRPGITKLQPTYIEWPYQVHAVTQIYIDYLQKELELCRGKNAVMLAVPFSERSASQALLWRKSTPIAAPSGAPLRSATRAPLTQPTWRLRRVTRSTWNRRRGARA